MHLRLVSLNVNGFHDVRKQSDVIDFARRLGCDVLLLQETRFYRQKDISDFQQRFRLRSFFSFGARNTCGVGIVVFNNAVLNRFYCAYDADGRLLGYDFILGSHKFRILNVYAPVQASKTNDFFRSIDASFFTTATLVFAGDFNCVEDTHLDVVGRRQGRPNGHAKEFRKLVSQFGLVDTWRYLHPSGTEVTRRSGTSGSRLDRIYISETACPAIVSCEHITPPTDPDYVIDHRAVVLLLHVNVSSRPRSIVWRLDRSLLHEADVVDKVGTFLKKSLEGMPPTLDAWQKLKASLKDLFTRLGKEKARERTQRLNRLSQKIRVVKNGGSLTTLAREYLESLYAQRSCLLRSSAAVSRLEHLQSKAVSGPEAYRYLHSIEIKRETALVSACYLADGSVSTDPDVVSGRFQTHFEQMFGGLQVDCPLTDPLFEELPRLAQVERDALKAPIGEDELDGALGRMKRGSAPGVDGLPCSFYAVFWTCLRGFLLRLYHTILSLHEIPESFSVGRIVLVPKPGADLKDVGSWRPITLLNVDHKLFTSVLSRRFRDVLPLVIHPNQVCSVPGKSMYCALGGVRDILAYTKKRNDAGALLSLDQAKAFDRVSHRYLTVALTQYGFPVEIVQLLERLYGSYSSRLCINGRDGRDFRVLSGVRQGCPLSPLLFVLAIDPFLRGLERDRNITGLPLPGNGSWKVLAYADDVLVFLRHSCDIASVFRVFSRYAALSGALLNVQKSHLLPVGNFVVPGQCDVPVCSSCRILGIPFGCDGVSATAWSGVVSAVKELIKQAELFDFSYKERAYIIRAKFCAKIWHLGQVQPPSQLIARKLHTLLYCFFWKNRAAVLNRSTLQLSPRSGGWSLPDVVVMCRCMCLKALLKTLRETDTPQCVLAVYFCSVLTRFLGIPSRSCPVAERPHRLHALLVAFYRTTSDLLGDQDISVVPASRVCELYAKRKPDARKLSAQARIQRGCFDWLPGYIQDLLWTRSWDILPTRVRLQRWGVVPHPNCVYCGLLENVDHIFEECRTAKVFWRKVKQSFAVDCPIRLTSSRQMRDKFSVLVTAFGFHALWKASRFAALRNKRSVPILYIVNTVRQKIVAFLAHVTVSLGEDAFCSFWGTDHISVRNGTVVLKSQPF